jgi:nucleotide-binding universal stress UspA family protein
MARRPFRILVDVDPSAPSHPALAQAVDLAARLGGRVTAVAVLGDVPRRARTFVTRDIEDDLVEHLAGELKAAVASLRPPITVATEVLRGKHARSVIATAVAGKADILMRSHGVHNPGQPTPFGPIDMNLLRHCPCPVWIVDARVDKRIRRVLAAINTNRTEQNQQGLNRRILEQALLLSEAEDAALTVLEVWEIFCEELLRPRLDTGEVEGLLEETRAGAEQDLDRFLAPFRDRLGKARVKLLRGEPAELIPGFVVQHDVDLVVMGTVARHGIAGLLMGNTAERVLRRLHGSVIAVKPPGFVDPGVEQIARPQSRRSAARRAGTRKR